jgi:hypothetical protein
MVERRPAPKPNRPRDPNAPPKPKRPRDRLGRPLAWEAEGSLELEDYDSLPLEENHRLGISHWNAERFFPAHEAWETCWKQAKKTGDAEFFKGLSQLGAGYVHLLRGNQHGAAALLRRGARRIEKVDDGHRGVPVKSLARVCLDHADQIEAAEKAGQPSPEVAFPKI